MPPKDAFATKSNGEPFTDEDKEEMRDTFDCKDGNLTLEGFFQVFALQSAGMCSVLLRSNRAFLYYSSSVLQRYSDCAVGPRSTLNAV